MRIARRLALLLLAVGLFVAAPAADESMSRVPEGPFWMGRTKLWLMDEIGWQVRDRSDDRPVHRLTLPAFFIDTHEVTNADYAALVAKKGAEPPWHWGGRVPPAGKEKLPVYNVSWNEAVKYCEAQGKRLPTEAEWEKAARGGTEGLDYSWGDDYAGAPAGEGGRPARRAHSGSANGPLAGGLARAQPVRSLRHVRQRVGMGRRLVRPLLLQREPDRESEGSRACVV